MTDLERQDDRVLAGALLGDPSLLPRFRQLQPSDFRATEARLTLQLARTYHERAVRSGQPRFAPYEAVEYLAVELLKPAGEPKKDASRLAALEALRSFIDEARSWPAMDEHDLDDRLARLAQRATEDKVRSGLVTVIDNLRAGNVDSVHQGLSSLAASTNPMAGQIISGKLSVDAINSLEVYYKLKLEPRAGKILTLLPRLDSITGGGRRGRLWLVAAYAKDGKTQLSKDLIYAASLQGYGCVVCTGEQTKHEVDSMFIVRHSHRFIEGGLPFSGVLDGTLTDDQERVYKHTIDDLSKGNYGPITIFQCPGGTSTTDLRAMLIDTLRHQPVDVAMFDHTLLFEPARQQHSEVAKTANVIREFKQIALDFNRSKGLWVVAPHQINREGKERADDRGYYVPTDLAQSAEAERSSDVGVWLWRNADLRDNFEIRLGVFINRWGDIEAKGWEALERFGHAAILPIEENAP